MRLVHGVVQNIKKLAKPDIGTSRDSLQIISIAVWLSLTISGAAKHTPGRKTVQEVAGNGNVVFRTGK